MTGDPLGLGALEPVDLDSVVAAADLRNRVDRKYVVPVDDAAALARTLAPRARILQIDGRRTTTYRSTYFDTADLRCCRDHLQGRRRRWKVRSRLYVEDALCRFEVKVRGGRGDTIKHALVLAPERYASCSAEERRFLSHVLGGVVPALHPVLEVRYTRATLADLYAGVRVTVDLAVTGRGTPESPAGLRAGRVAFADDVAIVETKGGARLSAADRALHALGHRPRALSKYATSASLLSDALPDNDVRRLVGQQIHLQPSSDPEHRDLPASLRKESAS